MEEKVNTMEEKIFQWKKEIDEMATFSSIYGRNNHPKTMIMGLKNGRKIT
jgi:hypothetical protein